MNSTVPPALSVVFGSWLVEASSVEHIGNNRRLSRDKKADVRLYASAQSSIAVYKVSRPGPTMKVPFVCTLADRPRSIHLTISL